MSASRDDNRIAWYENLDKGRFGPQQTLSNTLLGARAVIAADLDNDGDPDVIAASQDDNRIVWFENLSIVPTVLDADEEIEIVRSEYDVSVYPNPMAEVLVRNNWINQILASSTSREEQPPAKKGSFWDRIKATLK